LQRLHTNGDENLTARHPTRAPRKKRRRQILAAAAVLVVALGRRRYYFWFVLPYESTDDAFIEGYVIPMASQVPGRVAELLVKDNQAVKQGDVILKIDRAITRPAWRKPAPIWRRHTAGWTKRRRR